jgi:cystathionine beta-synthase
VGTGGTVTGIARHLKAQKPSLRVIGADPEGSVLSGDTARPYLTEGVGEDFFPGTYDPAMVDRWVRVSDRDAFAMARRITREEGILAGESCGTAMLAALDEAARLMREEPATAADAVLVVILPDGGRNYLSKLYNDEWMRANSLLPTTGAVARVGELLDARHHGQPIPDVVMTRTTDLVGSAIDLLQRYGISQLPVTEPAGDGDLAGIVGSVSEKSLLDRAYRNPDVVERTVGEVMDRPLPTLDVGATVDEAFGLLSDGAAALLVIRGGHPAGVVTKLDLLEFLAHSRG